MKIDYIHNMYNGEITSLDVNVGLCTFINFHYYHKRNHIELKINFEYEEFQLGLISTDHGLFTYSNISKEGPIFIKNKIFNLFE